MSPRIAVTGADDRDRDRFMPHLAREIGAALPAAVVEWRGDPARADWLVFAGWPDPIDVSPYPRLKGVLCTWAGVEEVLAAVPEDIPVARLIDPDGLTAGMTEWTLGHVMRHHLDLDRWIRAPHPGWRPHVPPLARERRVGLLGLGELGGAAARALAGLGFDVAGWSRRAKDIPGVASHTGPGGLRAVIERSEILVLLVPHTPDTEGLMDAERLGWMPEGAVLLNPGRGALVDEDALLAALPRLGHATLDTFRTEPLAEGHPFWDHPKVTVTPHVASATRPGSAAKVVAETLRRAEAGEGLRHVVDRAAGY